LKPRTFCSDAVRHRRVTVRFVTRRADSETTCTDVTFGVAVGQGVDVKVGVGVGVTS
jgi:hypothetical protein